MRKMCLVLLTLTCGAQGLATAQAQSQGLPTSQPSLLTIIREQVKVGRGAEHARIESGWPALYGRANSPDYYLAMTSMTGTPEAWYIIPSASHTTYAQTMGRDVALQADLDRLSRTDAEVLEGTRTVQAMARPDLSMGAYPDLSKQRFWEISIIRVRPGHEQEFDAAAKAYGTAAQRSAPNAQYRIYQVIAGMPTPTYIIFSSVSSYGAFDEMLADGMKTMQGANATEMAALDKFSKDATMSWETNRFRLDPKQSYVSREVRASDAAFWGPMPVATRPAAPAPKP
jgi:hypothetical protein